MTQQTWLHAELDEEELAQVVGGLIPLPGYHSDGESSSSSWHGFTPSEPGSVPGSPARPTPASTASGLKNVGQAFAAGVVAAGIVKGIQYAVHH